MIVVLLGPPGAGKGTQCKLLVERFGVPRIATGDLLREAIASGSAIGQLAKPYLDRGDLVPDATVVELVRERLLQPDAASGAVLDGFPRTIEQARSLDQVLASLGRRITRVIYLRVAVEEVVRRIAARYVCSQCDAPYHLILSPPQVAGVCDRCGGALVQRTDDTPVVVRRRLEVYETQTAPLVEFYQAHGLLVEIDGTRSTEDVFLEILAALGIKDEVTSDE
jgi:adenylate kinase